MPRSVPIGQSHHAARVRRCGHEAECLVNRLNRPHSSRRIAIGKIDMTGPNDSLTAARPRRSTVRHHPARPWPTRHRAIWIMGNPWVNRRRADTGRLDVFSSASNRCCVRFSVTRSADLVGEGYRIRQRALDEHARPAANGSPSAQRISSVCTLCTKVKDGAQLSMADRSSRPRRSGSARMSISTTFPPAIVKPSTENNRPSDRRDTSPMLPFTSTN